MSLLVLVGARPATAQTTPLPSPLGPAHVVAYALEHRAEIVAAQFRARAAAQRPAIVSSLGDPMVMVALDHLPFSLMGADGSVMVQQDFPLSGVLSRRRTVAEADARRYAADTRRVALDVTLDALRAYYMLAERRATGGVLDEQLAVARQLVDVSAARYGAGQASQADVLRAQGELARLEAERLALVGETDAAAAMLNAALGRDSVAPVPALAAAAPVEAPPAPAAVVRTAVAARPELRVAAAEQARARADVAVMESMYLPMAFVRAGGAYRMDDGPGAMLMLGVSVPIFRARLRAGVAEAQAMVAMADADRAAMARMVEGEAAASRAQVAAGRARLLALRERVLPLARQGVGAALAGYTAGQVPLVAVVEATRLLLEARMNEVMTDAALGLAWARLGRATGRYQTGEER